MRYLHKLESKVSVKYNNRPFVGIVTMVNDIMYVIPLTSQTTQERKLKGKRKRSHKVTTFIKDTKGREIANILYNNMIPVTEGVCTLLDIDTDKDTYEANEIRYIRRNRGKIIKKAKMVHQQRLQGDDSFLRRICCNFELLEEHYLQYKEE